MSTLAIIGTIVGGLFLYSIIATGIGRMWYQHCAWHHATYLGHTVPTRKDYEMARLGAAWLAVFWPIVPVPLVLLFKGLMRIYRQVIRWVDNHPMGAAKNARY